jgi:3-oxoacyl-[acyl-carrier-protein] synthase III
MLPLYQSLRAILVGDNTLATMLGATNDDPRIYQTAIQFHSEAAIRSLPWVTFNKSQDIADDTEQTQAIRQVRVELHVWHRDVDSDTVDQIEDRIRDLLDGVDLATNDLMAWFFIQDGQSSRIYEVDQKVWHSTSLYQGKVADRGNLPS